MSNHPFGLRGDPFVPPATLSAKEASRLIRRRVRACNGDGGLLFPIDTCDEIHACARGVPDRVLDLASRALRIAGAAGTAAVRPTHVKQAAEEATAAATATRAAQAVEEALTASPPVAPPVAMREAEPSPAAVAVPPERDEPEDDDEEASAAADAVPVPAAREATPAPPAIMTPSAPPRTLTRAERRAARRRSAASVTPAAAHAAAPARPVVEIPDEIDSDVPPFRPASVALPTRPSEGLPEEAREWVSRFIPSQGSGPAAGAYVWDLAEEERETVLAAAPSAPSRTAAPMPVAARAVPASRRAGRPLPWQRRQNTSRALVAVAAVVGLMAVVMRYSTREHIAPATRPSEHTERTAVRQDRARAPERAVTAERRQVERSEAPAPPAADRKPGASTGGGTDPVPSATPAASLKRLHDAGSTPQPIPGEPAQPGAPPRFALEVASFIFEERARLERDRLAGAGLQARVTTTVEFGSRVYRVVVGSYPHPAAAERSADSLLSNGVVLQARVVTAPNGR